MSQELINRSADLKQLQNEGYEVVLFNGYLLIHHVPYVNCNKQVAYGTLVSDLQLSGNITAKPNDHVALWVGDYPCDSSGVQLSRLVINSSMRQQIIDGLVATYTFSQKPSQEGYANYHQKMTQYIKMLENEARAIEPDVTAKTFLPVKLTEEESVFCYLDTASSRVGITSINEKFQTYRIAIIGLGGTGSYILDLLAKTPVEEIHLFDADKFLQHNAFRSPGAPSLDDLSAQTTKAEWFAGIYSQMRRKIIPHTQFIDESNVTELNSMDVVFICVDKGSSRQIIVNHLVTNKISFIDVGIGLINEDESLTGSVRITTCTPSFHNDIDNRIPFGDIQDNEYSGNIQIADINALNAALAVIKWKKMCGFYHDFEHENHTVYGISTNIITNDKIANETKYN